MPGKLYSVWIFFTFTLCHVLNIARFDNALLLPLFQRHPEHFTPGKIIGTNFENFKSVDYGQFVIRDSYLLLHTGLANLVGQLRKAHGGEGDDVWRVFPHTREWLQKEYGPETGVDSADHHLILKKGIYPYEYMTALSKLGITALPVHEAFHSALYGCNVSPEDYQHAQHVFKVFKCKTLRDYTDLYVGSDVVLLADVLAHRRKILYQTFKLDICHFVSLPSYAIQAVLKITGIRLELIRDPRMLAIIDKGVIGGISMVDSTLFEANSPYLDDPIYNSTLLKGEQKPARGLFDPVKLLRYIFTIDCNGLYSYCMTLPLPYKDFKWEKNSILTLAFVLNYSDDDRRGYFVEVDLEYPRELHRRHDSLPLAPEHKQILRSQLSDFQRKYLDKHNIKHAVGHKKVIPNLFDKSHYVCHIRNLRQYLRLGLRLKKVHAVISFRQRAWLRPYIELLTALRQSDHEDPFAVASWKLLMNVIYGKFIEDAHKYREFKMFNSFDQLLKYVTKAEFESARAYEENCGVVELKTGQPFSNKPRYLGMTILSHAKYHIYHIHYDEILPEFYEETNPDSIRLLMTDTDSLCYGFTTEKDVPKIFHTKLNHIMDYSNYPPTHPFYSAANRLVPGLWKEEWGGATLDVFVGLKPKMYSLHVAHYPKHESGKQTAKGISQQFKRKYLSHATYEQTILKQEYLHTPTVRIQRKRMELNTVEEKKVSLNNFNDKKMVTGIRDANHSFGFDPLPL